MVDYQPRIGLMMPRLDCNFIGYVKVEILTHHPRRWTWKVCKRETRLPMVMAKAPLPCAESAWEAGKKALAALQQGKMVGVLVCKDLDLI
jgi:hypothetical protein